MLFPTTAFAGSDRIALVLGLGAYQKIETLNNTRNDARVIAETLEEIGFDVTVGIDTSAIQMREMLNEFAFRSELADLALIYFAGHGVEVQGENFLIPTDADPKSNLDIQKQSVSLKHLLAAVDHARKMRIVILDSCRNNPFGDEINLDAAQTNGVSTSGGMAPANPDRGTMVAFAAKDGQVALDGVGGNSPYARALISKMAEPGLEISLMFRQVRDVVLRETRNLQEPHTYGSLSGTPFYLAGSSTGETASTAASPGTEWSKVRPDQEQQMAALAALGDTRSMLGLAYIHLNPDDKRFDLDEAIGFLERAVEEGSPEAQMELAKLLEKGIGVPIDQARALALYQQAADQDYADAINDLGWMYYQGGLGLRADKEKALELFGRAADLRHSQAMFNYAALIDDKLVADKGPGDAAGYLYASLRTGSQDVLDLLLERPTMFSLETRRELQKKLQEFEFYAGTIDGDIGPGTRRGIRAAYGLN
ncbi:caspase family protein [Sulfitobacter sp. F26204]|uniref:caspase family protein n=1 Tax=Sulfitobacter sp. F26204 TaxID=2996014 RepID=UPI00225DD464|nr:caspase family protein [Sulfitobacter sp. F26204]MCX7560415.1 caspase family protein [Sulfitobacter sp. F26204]